MTPSMQIPIRTFRQFQQHRERKNIDLDPLEISKKISKKMAAL